MYDKIYKMLNRTWKLYVSMNNKVYKVQGTYLKTSARREKVKCNKKECRRNH